MGDEDTRKGMSTTQDFRDMMYEFRGETREAFRSIKKTLDNIDVNGCKMGQRHDENIAELQKQNEQQWTKINKKVSAPKQKLAAIGIGSGGAGGIIFLALEWLYMKITSGHPPSVPPFTP